MAKAKVSAAGGYQLGRLVEQSGGMVDDVVYPTLLNDNEASGLKNISLDEKGTVKPCKGRTSRFGTAFDAANPCNGIAAFYPDPATTRLVMGAGTKLFRDTPHLINRWTDQAHFNESGSGHISVDTSTTSGDIRLAANPVLTFARNSTAFKQDGTSVASGVTRHEYIRMPNHRWQDLFDTDQLATQYTSGGDTAGTATVSGGALSYSDGVQATLLKTSLTLSDCEILINSDQAQDGGIIARHTDNNNYYMLVLRDDSSLFPNINLELYKRVAGAFTILRDANVTWARGTSANIRFTLHGSLLEAYFNGVKVISVTDTAFTGGSVGLRNSNATAFRVLDFTVHQAVQGATVEEGTTNLLTANQASVETDTTGFIANNSATLTRDTNERYSGSASLKVVTGNIAAFEGFYTTRITGTPGTVYSGQIRIKGASDTVRCYLRALPTDESSVLGQTTFDLTLNGTWQLVKLENFTAPANTGKLDLVVATQTQQAITFYADCLQIEQKAYATSWHLPGTTRTAETLTVPTANVFNKGNWTVEGAYTPQIPTNVGGLNKALFEMRIDANNWYIFTVDLNGAWHLRTDSGGVSRTIISAGNAVVQGTAYHWQISGDGSVMRLCVNGVQVGESTYTEPVGTLPTNMNIGNHAETSQANGLISNFRISSRARTLAEHQTAYNTGQPLAADEWVSCLALFNGNILASDLTGFIWTSATKDVSMAISTTSGKVERQITTPGASSVAMETRTSANGTTWDPWMAVLADGTIQSTYRQYIQVRARGLASGADKPSVQDITLSYDGTPSAAELATGFIAGGQFYFAALLSKLVITNKLDAPRVWDGINAVATLAGSPPHAQYIATHKNYMFMAHTTSNSSRLHFSSVLNIESWPVLNFIDVSPNDGDWITGLLPFDDYLIITKNRSIWILVGGGPSDFEVRRIHDGVGCVASRSLVKMSEVFAFASSEGYYFSDLSKPVLINERLKETWKGLNQRRLNQIAAEFFDHKLRIDVPNSSSTTNNLRIIYDTIRKCLYLEEFSGHASCYTKFMEAGQEVLLYGHSTIGQVSHADSGTSDAGAAINSEWKTKHFNFGSSATEKKLRNMYLALVPAASNTNLIVYFIVDNVEVSTPITISVTGLATEAVKTYELKPRNIGVRKVRTIGYRIVQSTTSGGVKIHELLQEYLTKKVKPS